MYQSVKGVAGRTLRWQAVGVLFCLICWTIIAFSVGEYFAGFLFLSVSGVMTMAANELAAHQRQRRTLISGTGQWPLGGELSNPPRKPHKGIDKKRRFLGLVGAAAVAPGPTIAGSSAASGSGELP